MPELPTGTPPVRVTTVWKRVPGMPAAGVTRSSPSPRVKVAGVPSTVTYSDVEAVEVEVEPGRFCVERASMVAPPEHVRVGVVAELETVVGDVVAAVAVPGSYGLPMPEAPR